MRNYFYDKIMNIVQNIDKHIVFLAIGITIAISYYFNPLDDVGILKWNRTFSTAVLSGISIDSRVANFYLLFLFYLPIMFLILLFLLSYMFSKRKKYKDYFMKFCILTVFATLASFISRYSANGYNVVDNPLIEIIIGFYILLSIIGILDKEQICDFSDIVMFFLSYVIFILLFLMLFDFNNYTSVIIFTGLILGTLSIVYLKSKSINRFHQQIKSFLYLFMWMPAVIRLALEGIYIFNEKGYGIQRYLTNIIRVTVLSIFIFAIISLIICKKKIDIITVGYIGFIVSICAIGYFSYDYQYVWSFGNYANLYELGNVTVAADSVLYGKLPIVDYFSAHALEDVWTRIIYCLIHGDINGILVNPYGGLSSIFAFIICYNIIKSLFNRDIAIMYTILFPGLIVGIKWTSICCLSIGMLIYISKKNSIPRYIAFWLSLLLCAFITYDEGIALGIACILSYAIFNVINKKWKELCRFGICGVTVGFFSMCIYMVYGLFTGVPIISRIMEWLSVSVGSSSSWATTNFGDQTSFAFFLSYFVVPITAILIMAFVLVKYKKNRTHEILAIITVTFSITEILYITRTIVFHNLAVCSGITGVLLNFIHWTVSLYVLYVFSEKNMEENIKLFIWMLSMILVILVEGTAVTKKWPSTDAILLSKGINSSEQWELSDSITKNIGKKRIVCDERSNVLINQFKNIFDVLLLEDQTFIDFANVTSMYLLADRKRPCYVAQSPSLLTDLYSQECYLEQIAEYDCPLAVIGKTSTSYLTQMVDVPHNIRYYKIAEFIYSNYRPLVSFGEIAIWCNKDYYDEYRNILQKNEFEKKGYCLIDYGYDYTISTANENGTLQYVFQPYHSFDLGMVPYIWANYDDYNALSNNVLTLISPADINVYTFLGSQYVDKSKGNYLSFEYTNSSDHEIVANIMFYDASNEGAMSEYYFRVLPGTNSYIIRISADYFWSIYNINTIKFGHNEFLSIEELKILEGD